MSNPSITARPGLDLGHQLRSLVRSFWLAVQYQHTFAMSDAQLLVRGLTRDSLKQHFLDDISQL